jgi:hypothetical protein
MVEAFYGIATAFAVMSLVSIQLELREIRRAIQGKH